MAQKKTLCPLAKIIPDEGLPLDGQTLFPRDFCNQIGYALTENTVFDASRTNNSSTFNIRSPDMNTSPVCLARCGIHSKCSQAIHKESQESLLEIFPFLNKYTVQNGFLYTRINKARDKQGS